MIKSMTGFGRAVCELPGKIITLEIKTLNSKQLDIYTRIPGIYREKDLAMRNILSQRLSRGKIELNLNLEITGAVNTSKINKEVVKDYYKQIQEITNELNYNKDEDLLQTILRLPDALSVPKEELNTEEWSLIEEKLNKCIDKVIEFRVQEGEALKKDILNNVAHIGKILEDVSPFEEERIKTVKSRLENSLKENLEPDKIDENRFEQELIFYLEKLDINEEKVRLSNHCKYFNEVVEADNNPGKKLGFIGQEMGREINTLGSKANHSEIQKLVVQMKDKLEKIKEQILNIL